MQRILIVGISGTGKTRLAQRLSDKLHVPTILLDTIFWKENWQEEDPNVVESKIRDAIRQDAWIIEGYIEPLGEERVKSADVVIYLDYPGHLALRGGLSRWRRFRGRARPEMPAGNIENFGWKFLMTLLRRDERPEIESAIKGQENKVIRLKSRHATEAYLKSGGLSH
jgi:adenylate kinase family enzyme